MRRAALRLDVLLLLLLIPGQAAEGKMTPPSAISLAAGLVIARGRMITPGLRTLPSATGDGVPALSQAAPPPPAPVPPNGSLVTATVLSSSVWPPGSLQGPLSPGCRDQPLYSLRVEIHTAQAAPAAADSFARAGMTVEAFSAEPFVADFTDAMIHATLHLSGDTRGVRWWISAIRVLPRGGRPP